MQSESLQSQYQRDGIAFPIPVLSEEEVRRFRGACDDLEEHLGGRPRTVEVRQMHLHFRWAYELAVHPRVLDAVEAVLGPDLLVWATELFSKHPHDSAVSIGWHRDVSYMGFDPELITTAWVALGPSRSSNGCMRVVLDAKRRDRETPAAAEVREEEMLEVVLQPGEMSLHDAHILHGSGANRSDEKRVGFAIRFIHSKARPLAGRPPVIRARGRDYHDAFQVLAPPGETSAEHALREMKQSAALHLDAMLHNLRQHSS